MSWRCPEGMTARMPEFDGRLGGGYSIGADRPLLARPDWIALVGMITKFDAWDELPTQRPNRYEPPAPDPTVVLLVALPSHLAARITRRNLASREKATKLRVGEYGASVRRHEGHTDRQVVEQRRQTRALTDKLSQLVAELELLTPRACRGIDSAQE